MGRPLGSPRGIVRRWLGVHLAASVAVFFGGIGLGWLLIANLDPAVLADVGSDPSLFPQRLTVLTILRNNLLALVIVFSGVVTFAVTTVASLLFNGLLIGFVLGATDPSEHMATAALILPHGILELPAFWLAGAVAFRVTHRLVRYLRGIDETVLSRSEQFEAVLLALVSVALIVLAAVIEARLTLGIAEWLTGQEFGGP